MEKLHDEPHRISELRQLKILDSSEDKEFSDIATIARDLCEVPMSAICLVDEARVWAKASCGLPTRQFPRLNSFCDFAIRSDQVLTIPDATQDVRFRSHPMVQHPPQVRSYAGAPIQLSTGVRVGTLSVFDVVPRALSQRQLRILEKLASQSACLMEYRAQEAYQRHALPPWRLLALGELLAGVAHEILNPLGVIVARAEQLVTLAQEQRCPQEMIERHAKSIERTGLRIGQIVRSVLDLARDREPASHKMTSIEELLKSVEEATQLRLEKHGIELIVHAPSASTFRCAQVPLEQALLNLVTNSIDAVEGLSERWIAIDVVPKDGHLEISVTDSGQGLSPEVQERLMTPFFTTKPQGKGTGLGLLMSKKFLEAHGGHLSYDPTSARTRFQIRLPFEEVTKP